MAASGGIATAVSGAVVRLRAISAKFLNIPHTMKWVMTAKRMKIAMDHSSARTLTSLFSWCVSGFTMSGIDAQRSFANGLFDPGLVHRDDGLPFQLIDERPDPDAADADQRGQTPDGVMEVVIPRRRDQPVDRDVA